MQRSHVNMEYPENMKQLPCIVSKYSNELDKIFNVKSMCVGGTKLKEHVCGWNSTERACGEVEDS